MRNPVYGVWHDRSSYNGRINEVANAVSMPLYGASANGGDGVTGKALMVGLGGFMRETTNGGQSWVDTTGLLNGNPIPHGVPWRIKDIHFVDNHTGFQVGQLTRIAKTTDDGRTWDHSNQPPDMSQNAPNLNAITFADSLHGVAVGAAISTGLLETIRYTVDQGATQWLTPASVTLGGTGTAANLLDACCSGFLSGKAIYWAAGEMGLILSSRDGGANWGQYMPPGPNGPAQPTAFGTGLSQVFIPSRLRT